MRKIGFFGLGLMGGNIVENLLQKNYQILTNKRGRSLDIKNKFRNLELFDQASHIAGNCELLASCVDTVQNLEEIVYGKNGILEAESLPEYFFDFGTGRPSFSKKLYNDLQLKGCTYIDMPIGRTPAHALRGEINLFISSKEEKIAKYSDLLNDIAENKIYLGDLGQGTKIKLFNNFYGQAITLIFGQILRQGKQHNLDLEKLLTVMSLGPLSSGMLDAIFPHFEDNLTGSIEFTISNAYKDLVYFKEEFGNQYPIVDLVLSSFETVISKGYGELSVGEVAKYVD